MSRAPGGGRSLQRGLAARPQREPQKIGDVLRDQGDLAGALEAYRESLAVRRRLAAADPSNAGWQRDLTVSHDKDRRRAACPGRSGRGAGSLPGIAGGEPSAWRRPTPPTRAGSGT